MEHKEKNMSMKRLADTEDEATRIMGDFVNRATHNDRDALNPILGPGGQVVGSHEVNANEQTDLDLGGIADPGGLNPAMDMEQTRKDFKTFRRKYKM